MSTKMHQLERRVASGKWLAENAARGVAWSGSPVPTAAPADAAPADAAARPASHDNAATAPPAAGQPTGGRRR